MNWTVTPDPQGGAVLELSDGSALWFPVSWEAIEYASRKYPVACSEPENSETGLVQGPVHNDRVTRVVSLDVFGATLAA